MDLDAVRTFVAVAEVHQFHVAGGRLGISQQAVSKRIAALEHDLGVRLFARTPRGAMLTIDGHALLPRARDLLRAESRALAAVRPDRRALRVDVINPRIAPAALLPKGIRTARVLDEPLVLLTGPEHPLADRAIVTPAELAAHPIWSQASSPAPSGRRTTPGSPVPSASRSTARDPTSPAVNVASVGDSARVSNRTCQTSECG